MPFEVYSKGEVDSLLASTAPAPEPAPTTTLSSRPVYAEDFGLTEDTDSAGISQNNAAINAALVAARECSRRLWFPPGEFHVSEAFNCSGVDVEGTQAHRGARLVQTAPNTDLIKFTGRDHNGDFCTRGGLKDMLLFSTASGGVAVHVRGDATRQPDHLRIERVRIGGMGSGSWFIGLVVNGLDRSTGAIGNRGLHVEEVLIFSVTGNYAVIRGSLDSYFAGVRCYVPLGADPTFHFAGDANVPNENIRTVACEALNLYYAYNKRCHFGGWWNSVTNGGNNVSTTVGV